MPYTFKTKPYKHQRSILKKTWKLEHFALLMEMGTGKSKVILDTVGALYEAGKIEALVVVAPKGCYLNWANEIDLHLPNRIERSIAVWSSRRKDKNLLTALVQADMTGWLKIILVNVEAIRSKKEAFKQLEDLLKTHTALLCIDESTTIKNHKAKQTKACFDLGKLATYRRILSGQPIENNPMDLYSQFHFLQPGCLGYTSFFAYRATYARLKEIEVGSSKTGKKWKTKIIINYMNLEDLALRIEPHSYRVTKKECLDLPEKIYERRIVEMTAEQRKIYKELREYACTQFDDGEITTATEAIVVLGRLHQVSCGFLPTDEGELRDIPNNRMDALLELLEDASGNVIIWAHFRHSIRAIREAVTKTYGDDSAVDYYGESKKKERAIAVQKFNDPSDPCRFFISNRAGAYGINLVSASTVVYFDNDYAFGVRQQSEDRAHRIGQNRAVTYIDIVTRGTIDTKILRALRNKQNISRLVLRDGIEAWT